MNQEENQRNVAFFQSMLESGRVWLRFYNETVRDYLEMGDHDSAFTYENLRNRVGESFKQNKRRLKETVRDIDASGHSTTHGCLR